MAKVMGIGAVVAAALAAGGVGEVRGAIVNLGVDPTSLSNLTPAVTSRLKFDMGGGVDQMLYKGSSPVGGGAADVLRMSAVGGQYFGSVTYNFVLQHVAATNTMVFSLTSGAVTGQATFANAGSANSTLTQTVSAGELSYNVFQLHAQALNGSTASFTNFTFTPGTGLSTSGAVASTGSVTGGTYNQYLAAPTGFNLDGYDWTLSMRVTLQENGLRANGEALRIQLAASNGTYSPTGGMIPEPATGMVAVGMVASIGLRRRR